MILVDTSVWVDFLRGSESRATQHLRALVRDPLDAIAMCEPVAMELLAGVTREVDVRRIEEIVDGLPTIDVDPMVDFRAAAAVYREVRRSGSTVRSQVDCLIAAVALRTGATLLHQDRDYEVIAPIVGLRHQSLREPSVD